MHLQISKKVLTEAIRLSVSGKVYPIMESVRLTAGSGSLVIDGFDGVLYTSHTLPCDVMQEGAVLINKKQLTDALKKLKDTKINIKADGDALYLNNIKLPTFNNYLEEFYLVDFQPEHSFILPSEAINYIEKVRHAVSKDESRFAINGVHLKGNEIVATDGHRLALYSLKSASFKEITLPVKLVDLLLKIKIKSDNNISFNKEMVCVEAGSYKVYGYITDAIFPNYRDVIPSDDRNILIIKANKEALIDIIERVIIGDDRKDKSIQIDILGSTLKVKTAISSGGYYSYDNKTDYYSEAEMPIEILRGFELKIGFNSKYLLDAIRPIQGDVIIKFIDKDGQITVLDTADDGYLALVMPMTIDIR
jgi:DNA polymerase-3 subunit beta